ISMNFFLTIKEGKRGGAVGAKKPAPLSAGFSEYDYELQNDTFAPMYQFAMQVDVPFNFSSVSSPPGWSAVPWNPLQTPDVVTVPAQMSEPADPDDIGMEDFTFSYGGILWYK